MKLTSILGQALVPTIVENGEQTVLMPSGTAMAGDPFEPTEQQPQSGSGQVIDAAHYVNTLRQDRDAKMKPREILNAVAQKVDRAERVGYAALTLAQRIDQRLQTVLKKMQSGSIGVAPEPYEPGTSIHHDG